MELQKDEIQIPHAPRKKLFGRVSVEADHPSLRPPIR